MACSGQKGCFATICRWERIVGVGVGKARFLAAADVFTCCKCTAVSQNSSIGLGKVKTTSGLLETFF